MSNLIENVAICHYSYDLDADDHKDLSNVNGWQITVSYSKHGGQSEIQGVNVLLDGSELIEFISFEPIVLFVQESGKIEHKGKEMGNRE